MKEIEIIEMLKDMHEFSLSDKNIRKAIKKEKNWTAPGVDGIENFGLKMFAATWKPLSWAMNEWIRDQTALLEWLEIGQIDDCILEKVRKHNQSLQWHIMITRRQ